VGVLRNPAYCARVCYGKTEQRPRQRITGPLRQRNGIASRDSASHERPRQEWIEVPVPALVSEEVFPLAQEQLPKNAHHSPRRTIESTLLQGMPVCKQSDIRCIEQPREPPNRKSTIIAASARMDIAVSKGLFAPNARKTRLQTSTSSRVFGHTHKHLEMLRRRVA
jgi:hypothetical protein